jgi:predicted NBD/HSP70 family sugar kinase
VILGGGMALAGELLRSRVEKLLNEGRAFAPIWKTCKLRMAKLGDDAGLLGAARMAFQRTNSTSSSAQRSV